MSDGQARLRLQSTIDSQEAHAGRQPNEEHDFNIITVAVINNIYRQSILLVVVIIASNIVDS